jgi:hypothetical protein
LSSAASKIQVLNQNNAMAVSCKRIAPIQVSYGAFAPAQVVYDAAIVQVKERAAELGADSVVLLDHTHTPGATNHFLFNASALKCY